MENSRGRETPAVLKDISDDDLPKTEEGKKLAEKLPVRNVIGRLWWLALISRPDIYCALHKCAIWQNKPNDTLWSHLMDILKYLNNTRHIGIVFKRPENFFPRGGVFHGGGEDKIILSAVCDSNFANEPGSKSRYGYYFFLEGALTSWVSAHSTRVVTSSTEAECHGLVHTGKENLWQREFVGELGIFEKKGTQLLFIKIILQLSAYPQKE
jgi:hypothetical protein